MLKTRKIKVKSIESEEMICKDKIKWLKLEK